VESVEKKEEKMKARGFTHVSIVARDLDESAKFYAQLFGLEEVPSPDFSRPVRWFRVGDLQLHLFESDDEAHFSVHFALDVDDFEAVYREAQERGCLDNDSYAGVRELPDGAAQAYLRDPAGNLIEINYPDVSALDRAVIGDVRKVEARSGWAASARLYMR
jgi:catechol 2,3-dioxygenase-like lactoylglutathione lyase family enzyme